MKPLNLDNSPCSPISSNCVIWQGPNIPCIKLCTGDTVSDVIEKLATELCTIIDQLNVSNYDLSCFNLTTCPPEDFQALIQFLINQICEAQGITVDPSRASSGCPDCVVSVAPCFIQGTTTTMQLVDYVNMIANRICTILTAIADLQNQINDLDIRVTVLENTPPPTFTLPSIPVDCILVPGSYPIDTVLNALMNDADGYCALLDATGTPSDISIAVLSQCIEDTDNSLASTLAGPTETFEVFYAGDWITSSNLNTVADAINNIWISICDIYNYVSTIGLTVQNTSTIDLDYTSNVLTATIVDTGWKDLVGFNYYSGVTKPQCRRIGNQVHFRGNVYVPLENPASPGSVIPLTSNQAYNGVQGCTTWSGAGGCSIDVNGSIAFNNGASVVPTSITTGNFDALYRSGWQPIARQILIDGTYGTALTSIVNIFITANKQLEVQTLIDIEDVTGGTPYFGNSPFRFITSNVRTGEYLPNYIAPASDIQNAPSNANFPLVSNTYNNTWDFNCDAAQPAQIGGFEFSLDGMIAYLNPCNIETGLSTTCP